MTNCTQCNKKLTGRQEKYCSSKCKNDFHQNYACQQLRGLKRMKKLLEMHGSKCATCGYSKNSAALDFHHTGVKNFSLTVREMSNRKWKSLKAEAESCKLLCSNCHREHHYPHLNMPWEGLPTKL